MAENSTGPFDQIRLLRDISRQELESNSTRHARSFYMGDHLHLCKVLSKYKMYVDTRDVGIAPNILMDGYWESWITKFIAGRVEPGSNCIDAGANFGYYSVVLAELSGRTGRTIAIEPNSYLCRLLSFTSTLNEFHFEIVQKALSDAPAELTLTVPASFWGGGTIRTEKVDDHVFTEPVQAETLDAVVETKQLDRVDFIKMDCEGVEPQIFQGMTRILQQNPQLKMVMEYSPFMYRQPQEFTEWLLKNFTVGEITGDSTLIPYSEKDSGHLLNLSDHVDLFLQRKPDIGL